MQINLENLVPISEANQNFSKVARMVDNKGTAVILKNNKPKYVLVEYDTLIKNEQRWDRSCRAGHSRRCG